MRAGLHDDAAGPPAQRTALEEALHYPRHLVIVKLDRLCRSVRDLRARADDGQTRRPDDGHRETHRNMCAP